MIQLIKSLSTEEKKLHFKALLIDIYLFVIIPIKIAAFIFINL